MKREALPFGQLQGHTPCGVPCYSNKSTNHFSAERNFHRKVFCGYKYQCVEFARRWLLQRKGLLLTQVGCAAHLFNLTEVKDAATAKPVRCVPVPNGTAEKPQEGTLLIYPITPTDIHGHVAVVTEVGDDYLCMADQNDSFHKWEGPYSSRVELRHQDGKWTIKDFEEDGRTPLNPVGWLTFPDTPNRPVDAPPVQVHSSFHFEPEAPWIRRVVKHVSNTSPDWLDLTIPSEARFAEMFGTDLNRSRFGESEVSYYEANMELHMMCVRYCTQLHDIFMEATAQVLESDELLRRFSIPEEFWPRIRHSWKTQKASLTSRFDLAFNNQTGEMKCFEYNADSAGALLECGVVQEKWARSIGVDTQHSMSSGYGVTKTLMLAWKASGFTGRIHFLTSTAEEEEYTTRYCMETAQSVGMDTKLCLSLDEFRFTEAGYVVDGDGVPVKHVWKTWMWDTAITDHYEAAAERGEGWAPSPTEKVRLCDIMLGRDWDMAFLEPMWKLIPSNKAILPLIYHNHPEHPAILRAEFEVTDELRRTGYAQKPIVGRVGFNVSVVGPDGKLSANTDGKYSDRDMVYQELFNLSKVDDYYAIIGGWMIGDTFAGTGIREDRTIITGAESPFAALRVLCNDATGGCPSAE